MYKKLLFVAFLLLSSVSLNQGVAASNQSDNMVHLVHGGGHGGGGHGGGHGGGYHGGGYGGHGGGHWRYGHGGYGGAYYGGEYCNEGILAGILGVDECDGWW
jgi:hypothetical protein